jgi:O-antigen biosynthesis protein
MSTITSSVTHGITLATSGSYASPLTITVTGGVTASSGDAVYGPSTQAWTVANYGTVLSTSGKGINFAAGGSVDNTGLIEGQAQAIYITGSAGTVTNSGTINGEGPSNGIDLLAGGSVINTGTGLIEGYFGVATSPTTPGVTTVTNFGTIIGTSNNGVALDEGGTVIDSGTIIGASGHYAISFGGFGGNAVTDRLVLDPGYRLVGNVFGNAGATNTLELASTASAGTVSAVLATEFVNFGTVTVDAGARWTLTNNSSLTGITLTDSGSLTNTGTLTAPESATWSVYVDNAGFLSNSATGYIGAAGIGLLAGGTLVNAGQIVDKLGPGVYIGGTTGTVTNSGGTISGEGGGQGVELLKGGSVTNTGGTIQGYTGVQIDAVSSTVTNSATITGTGGGSASGVDLNDGGSVGNTGGLIQGYTGVLVAGAAGTVTNTGTIIGTSGDGVELELGGTVIDSGTISGGYGVRLDGSGGDLLVLEQGYKLTGGAYGGVSGTNTLGLSGSLGAVTVTYNTLGLVHFQDVAFGATSGETLKITNNSTLPGTISGFTVSAGQTIDLTTLAFAGNTSVVFNAGTLTVTEGASSVSLKLGAASYPGIHWVASSDGGTGTDITPACFCRGTLILTEKGEVAVEDLAIGDRVVTLSGALRAIKWIGRRAYDGRFVAANRAVLPIRVAAGALAPGLPARDLLLSPEHALYIDGALVPAGLLVNGATVRQVESLDRLEYFHIELERHDVILADGAPAESFVDCDSRGMFHNAGEFAELYPDDAPAPWAFCAPRAEAGSAALAAIRAALSERARALGYGLSEAALPRPIADDAVAQAQSAAEGPNGAPAAAGALAITSRNRVPAELKLAS